MQNKLFNILIYFFIVLPQLILAQTTSNIKYTTDGDVRLTFWGKIGSYPDFEDLNSSLKIFNSEVNSLLKKSKLSIYNNTKATIKGNELEIVIEFHHVDNQSRFIYSRMIACFIADSMLHKNPGLVPLSRKNYENVFDLQRSQVYHDLSKQYPNVRISARISKLFESNKVKNINTTYPNNEYNLLFGNIAIASIESNLDSTFFYELEDNKFLQSINRYSETILPIVRNNEFNNYSQSKVTQNFIFDNSSKINTTAKQNKLTSTIIITNRTNTNVNNNYLFKYHCEYDCVNGKYIAKKDFICSNCDYWTQEQRRFNYCKVCRNNPRQYIISKPVPHKKCNGTGFLRSNISINFKELIESYFYARINHNQRSIWYDLKLNTLLSPYINKIVDYNTIQIIGYDKWSDRILLNLKSDGSIDVIEHNDSYEKEVNNASWKINDGILTIEIPFKFKGSRDDRTVKWEVKS